MNEMDVIQIKKQTNRISEVDHLEKLSKQELIAKIKSLECHNIQLQNIIAKSNNGAPKKQSKRQQKPFDFTKCNFRHVLLKFLYLGWDYQGYAIQEDTINTIEYHLFNALTKTCLIRDRNSSNYHRCGRTDKGVSSFGQVISIDLRSKLSMEHQNDTHNEINYCNVLNKVLPDTIQCIAWYPIDNDFSARFDCKRRTYKYFFPKAKLDIEKMQAASLYLLGTHDFRNFCRMDVGNGVVKFVRNILSIDIKPYNKACDDECCVYILTIKGQAFLWHQIRCIMGILFLIGQGRESPEIINELLDIETNSRKPDYNMASEVPLNLYACEYDVDIQWQYDWDSLNPVMLKLHTMWTFTSIKSTMLECMLNDLYDINTYCNSEDKNEIDPSYTNCLLNGAKTKNYIPLLQRQKCESLENRIKHYVKRQKLEILDDPSKRYSNATGVTGI